MRLYAELAKRSFRRWATYRAATLAGIFTNSVFGFIRASVLLAVLAGRPGAGGLDVSEVITYSFITQGLLSVTDVFGSDQEIAGRVRSGDVVGDLYRPVDFQAWWFAADVGRAAFQALGRAVPIVVVGALTYGIEAPHGVAGALLFSVSVALAVVVGFSLKFLVNLSAFWLLDIRGPNQMMVTAALFFSGLTAPLTLFPDWLEPTARALPFACLIQYPVEIFLGKAAGAEAGAVLAIQAAWAVALIGLGRLVLRAATRRVVIQGG